MAVYDPRAIESIHRCSLIGKLLLIYAPLHQCIGRLLALCQLKLVRRCQLAVYLSINFHQLRARFVTNGLLHLRELAESDLTLHQQKICFIGSSVIFGVDTHKGGMNFPKALKNVLSTALEISMER